MSEALEPTEPSDNVDSDAGNETPSVGTSQDSGLNVKERPGIVTLRIENFLDLFPAIDKAQIQLRRELWWRGQAKESWQLVAGIHRPGLPDSERSLNTRFMAGAPARHPDTPPLDDAPSWLFLMQHYRFPTRLLDWTESPLIAAYFAAIDHLNSDAVLWAVDPFTLNLKQFGKFGVWRDNAEDVAPLFEGSIRPSVLDLPKVAALVTTHRHLRMLVQMSRFTIHGIPDPLEKLPESDRFLVKIVIPASAKAHLVNALWNVGIRLSNIFPDLEYLSQDILAKTYVHM
jgi:FRG domain